MREEIRKIALELDTDKASSFQSVARTKEKVIEGALGSYAKGCPREDILAVMDTSVFGGGKSGFILTEKKLYSSHFIRNGGIDKKAVLLDGLIEAKWDLKNKNLCLRYNDGCFFEVYISIYTECILKLLQAVIALKEETAGGAEEEKATEPETLAVQESLEEPEALNEPTGLKGPDTSGEEEGASKEDEASEAVRAALEEEKKELEKERKAFIKEQKELEREKKAFAREKKAFEKEQKAFIKEKKALEKEQKALEKERKALEKEQRALEKEGKALEKEQKAPEKEKEAFEEKHPEEEIDRDIARERFLEGLKSTQDPDELYEMGKYCEKGDGYEKYYRKAADFYERAAKKGHADAQLSLAIYYLYGLGVGVDLGKAEYWGKKAEASKCQDTLSLEMLFDEIEMKRQVREEIY